MAHTVSMPRCAVRAAAKTVFFQAMRGDALLPRALANGSPIFARLQRFRGEACPHSPHRFPPAHSAARNEP